MEGRCEEELRHRVRPTVSMKSGVGVSLPRQPLAKAPYPSTGSAIRARKALNVRFFFFQVTTTLEELRFPSLGLGKPVKDLSHGRVHVESQKRPMFRQKHSHGYSKSPASVMQVAIKSICSERHLALLSSQLCFSSFLMSHQSMSLNSAARITLF